MSGDPISQRVIRRLGHTSRHVPTPPRSGLVALLAALATLAALAVTPVVQSAAGASQADFTPPSSPGPLVVTVATQTSITLTWLPATDDVAVAEYGVYWNSRRPKDMETTLKPTFTKTGLRCGTTYTVRVIAFDASRNHSQKPSDAIVSTAACVDASAPSTPSGVTQIANTQTTATLSWKPSTDDVGVAGYAVSTGGVLAGTTAGTSYTVSGLTCGSVYTAVVQAYDAAGNRSAAASFTGSTAACSDTAPPKAPTGLAQSSATATSMAISWNASSGAARYGVYVDSSRVSETSSRSATVSSLACGTTYSVAVDAVDAAGNRSARTTVQMATSPCPTQPSPGHRSAGDTTPPTTPAGLAVTSASQASVAVRWSASSDNVGVVGYSITKNGAPAGDTTGTTFLVTAVQCGATVTVGVEARDAAGNRSQRATVTAKAASCVDGGAPSMPGAVTLQNRTETSLTFTWAPSTDVVGVAGYGVYVDGKLVDTTTQPQYTVSGLACSSVYTVGVDAFDAQGNRSASSTTLLATSPCTDVVPPSAPTGLTVSGATETTLTVKWSAAKDDVAVAGYDLYVDDALVQTTKTLTLTLDELECDTPVVVGVEAFDAAGNRSDRATVQGRTAACGGGSTSGSLYVSGKGSDSGQCTQSVPCASIDQAYEVARPGQRIVVAPGSYPSQTIAYDPSKASATSRVTISAQGATFAALTFDGVQHLTLEGVTVTGRLWLRPSTQSRITSDARPVRDVEIRSATLREFLFRNVDSVTLRDSSVGGYDVSTSGLGVPKVGAYEPDGGAARLDSRNVVIERVRFHDILRTQSGTTHAECLYLDGGIDGLVVRQSTFTNCGVFDVFGQPNGGNNDNITLENNVFDIPRNEDGSAAGSALNFKSGPGGSYRNLVIRFNSVLGNIRSDSGSYSGVSVVGNALMNTACPASFPASAFDRNLTSVGCGPTDVQADPQFRLASRSSCSLTSCPPNDLRLASGSSGVDLLSSGPPNDVYGSPRPRGRGYDAGAVESG